MTLRPTAVRDVLQTAVTSLPGAKVDRGLAIEISDDLPKAEADPGLLERALDHGLKEARMECPYRSASRRRSVHARRAHGPAHCDHQAPTSRVFTQP
ncbi:hypothetical protein [Actinacidiphila oryziradicis]|uniref:hypothetical protein n=1 Tax=Actinacidiphila oryziradicis TaxID=2571141 RepID=UPI0023F56F8E|nr:hypothetical protein [Actinacidiphila oryziradicis]